MINRENRKRMREYLTDRLQGSGVIVPKKEKISGVDVNYLKINGNRGVLLVDRNFSAEGEAKEKTILKIYDVLTGNLGISPDNLAMIVYKDPSVKDETDAGKEQVFFRSDAQHGRERLQYGDLKEYTADIGKMMRLTPEEIFIQQLLDGRIQYFQPITAKIHEESLRQYTARPVDPKQGGRVIRLGLGSIDNATPANYILTLEHEFNEPFELCGHLLLPRSYNPEYTLRSDTPLTDEPQNGSDCL